MPRLPLYRLWACPAQHRLSGGARLVEPTSRRVEWRRLEPFTFPPFRGQREVTQYFSYQYALFPNTSLTFDSRHIELWQILPTGPDTSEVIHTAYLRPGLSEV